MALAKHAVFPALMAAAVIFIQQTPAVFAQNGISLEIEIQNIERTAVSQGISAAERHAALVRLARLRQLSGDIEGAAKNWLEAAAAIPGQVDDDALLACAYCLAAMGEWDRACTVLEPLLAKYPRARFLDISIKAILSGDTSALAALSANPEFSQMKSEIYFMLWNISRRRSRSSNGDSAEIWRQRLLEEFPHSPEGRLASMQSLTSNTNVSIIIQPNPFWLFMGGLDSLPLEAVVHSAAPAPKVNVPAATPAPQAVTQQVKLQTGLFSRQVNAQAQVNALRQAGFSPSMEQRVVNNNEMWAVIVIAGADSNRTIRELRDAGFESFPLR